MYGSFTRWILEESRQNIADWESRGRRAAHAGEPRSEPVNAEYHEAAAWLRGYDAYIKYAQSVRLAELADSEAKAARWMDELRERAEARHDAENDQ